MTDNFIDFAGFKKEEVLQALHDCAKPHNNSDFYYRFGSLNLDYAKSLLETRDVIDYLNGRFLYVSFASFPLIDETKYNRQNGNDKMWEVLEILRIRKEYEK